MSTTIGEEVLAVRAANPSWDFQRAWDHIAQTQPWRFSKSVEMNRLDAKEMPQKEKETREKFERVECIARRLMARDRSLTFGVALERVKLCLPQVQVQMANELRQAVERKSRTMLICGHEASYVD
jgi:hypothetical protein